MVSATAELEGETQELYGGHADGLLVFTDDGHFVEVLVDASTPPFAAADRMRGTPGENAAAVAGALGQFGTYEVDEAGQFARNTIRRSTFPNWSGLTRDSSRLQLSVTGDRLVERLADPGAPVVVIVYERVDAGC